MYNKEKVIYHRMVLSKKKWVEVGEWEILLPLCHRPHANHILTQPPLEFVFREQSYSSLHSELSLEWDHFCGVIADPCDN